MLVAGHQDRCKVTMESRNHVLRLHGSGVYLGEKPDIAALPLEQDDMLGVPSVFEIPRTDSHEKPQGVDVGLRLVIRGLCRFGYAHAASG